MVLYISLVVSCKVFGNISEAVIIMLNLLLYYWQWYWDHWSSTTTNGGSEAVAWTARGM